MIDSWDCQKYIQNANRYCELRKLNFNDHTLRVGSPYKNNELILFFRWFDKELCYLEYYTDFVLFEQISGGFKN